MAIETSGRACDRIVLERGARRLSIRLPRHGVLAVSLLGIALGAWSIAAGAYVLFHDTVVAELRTGAKAASRGYEAQITALRGELERARTRGMVERSDGDRRMAELLRRQEAIEQRQSRLSELAGPGHDSAAPADTLPTASIDKPVPLDAARGAPDDFAAPTGAAGARPGVDGARKVSQALDRVELGQARALEALALQAGDRRRMLEQVYDAAGVAKPRLSDGRARGGPFEPPPAAALTFEARIDEVAAERAAVAALDRGLARVPIRTPSPGASVSSGFGVRTDPFLGRAAFHAGLDFEQAFGAPVRATAAGRVVAAGWSGGYGNMVEIDHGGGLSTRFGHLSSIAVVPGQEVTSGQTLGRVGSTGRSTGPHLHYETRVAGEAVDPLRFLNAGRRLVQRR